MRLLGAEVYFFVAIGFLTYGGLITHDERVLGTTRLNALEHSDFATGGGDNGWRRSSLHSGLCLDLEGHELRSISGT